MAAPSRRARREQCQWQLCLAARLHPLRCQRLWRRHRQHRQRPRLRCSLPPRLPAWWPSARPSGSSLEKAVDLEVCVLVFACLNPIILALHYPACCSTLALECPHLHPPSVTADLHSSPPAVKLSATFVCKKHDTTAARVGGLRRGYALPAPAPTRVPRPLPLPPRPWMAPMAAHRDCTESSGVEGCRVVGGHGPVYSCPEPPPNGRATASVPITAWRHARRNGAAPDARPPGRRARRHQVRRLPARRRHPATLRACAWHARHLIHM